jgi:hypothetical protein
MHCDEMQTEKRLINFTALCEFSMGREQNKAQPWPTPFRKVHHESDNVHSFTPQK